MLERDFVFQQCGILCIPVSLCTRTQMLLPSDKQGRDVIRVNNGIGSVACPAVRCPLAPEVRFLFVQEWQGVVWA